MAYHFVAAVFYLSASVALAYITFLTGLLVINDQALKIFRLDISAVVGPHTPRIVINLIHPKTEQLFKCSIVDQVCSIELQHATLQDIALI